MGSTKRSDIVSKTASEMPGPGNYDNKHKEFGSDAKSVSFNIN